MAGTTAKHPGDRRTAKSTPSGRSRAILLLVVLSALAVCVIGSFLTQDDSGTEVPPPAAAERADTVPILAQAATSQGICYGWRLQDDDSTGSAVNVGSNLGDGVAVDSDEQRCPRWVEVVATVGYVPESSESADWSSVWVDTSAGLRGADIARGLDRFGLDSAAFIDDPGWAIVRAAAVLPLLTAETGQAVPGPMATGTPPASLAPLAGAGSDYWRDRWLYFLGGGGLLLVTGLMFTAGWLGWRRERAGS